ncbi:hypothetical protein GLX27_002669 [Malassezia furfur]|uniref:Uncharacterized protein n=1 Tax=Malassezia furfur TaxID=55194 RepID=A0ABY8ESH2_MALFU|nr:hypothetical protein GLX27_002669 [Malassezia furfur]
MARAQSRVGYPCCIGAHVLDTRAGTCPALTQPQWPLAELYRQLPSPPRRYVDVDDLPLRCTLYTYQQNSLSKLLQRENDPESYCDPYYLQRTAPIPFQGQRTYVMDPTTYEFFPRTSVNVYPDVLGGILCDEMGVGKTMICLALILATLTEVSQPAQEPMASATTSELALSFPEREYQASDPAEALTMDRIVTAEFGAPSPGERLSRVRKPTQPEPEPAPPVEQPQRTVSLAHIAAHRLRTTSRAPPLDTLPPQLQELMGAVSAPFIHLWPPPPTRMSRVSQSRTPLRVYLTSATLVLVPLTLLVQWTEEIEKHCLPGSLRVLALADAHTPLPDALCLAQDYDVVLMSHARFGKEAGDEQHGMRSDLDASPLLQVFWKRLIIDEGNILAGDSLVVRLCSYLRVERRWIVTGTPTEAMVGSSLRAAGHTAQERARSAKAWSAAERKSLDRLKLLLVRFLRLAPFVGAPVGMASAARASGLPSGKERDWNALMASPPQADGLWSAKFRLYDVLSRLMVRNRVEDVDKECPLPPLEHRVVPLVLSDVERKTYNVLQSLIVLNAALSEETDKDYFFHASNRKALAAVMENLALACFHFAGQGFLEQTQSARQLIESQQAKLQPRYQTPVREAIAQLDGALGDAAWQAHLAAGDVLYAVDDAASALVQAWSGGRPGGITADELVHLRRAAAAVFRDADLDAEDMLEELITKGMHYARRKAGKPVAAHDTPKAAAALASDSATASANLQRARHSVQPRGRARAPWEDVVEVPAGLHDIGIRATSSTKLNALLDEILAAAASEKILVFSMHENMLFELAAALDVAQVPYLCYVAGMPQKLRNEYASTFARTPTYRCLLMSTTVGGRGLDLHCASRVIFTEPVWQPDLESQAVKRAWRMGQTQRVVVSTYVMQNTFEQEMLARKHDRMKRVGEDVAGDTKQLTDDPGMRDFVAHPRFVPAQAHSGAALGLSLFDTERPWHEGASKRRKYVE